jgi:hypothetical protein
MNRIVNYIIFARPVYFAIELLSRLLPTESRWQDSIAKFLEQSSASFQTLSTAYWLVLEKKAWERIPRLFANYLSLVRTHRRCHNIFIHANHA